MKYLILLQKLPFFHKSNKLIKSFVNKTWVSTQNLDLFHCLVTRLSLIFVLWIKMKSHRFMKGVKDTLSVP
jgi:hypothetical protein